MTVYKTRFSMAVQSQETYYQAANKAYRDSILASLDGDDKNARYFNRRSLVYKTMGLIAYDRCLTGTNARYLGAPV